MPFATHRPMTKMAIALKENGLKYETVDFTDEARGIWYREIATANELKEMFEKEGNLDLCEERIQDATQTLSRMDNLKQRRYFYLVKNQ